MFGDGDGPSAVEAEGISQNLVQSCLALISLMHCFTLRSGPSLRTSLEAVASGVTSSGTDLLKV